MRKELHEVRQRRILAAAHGVFMAKGFSRATVDDVARSARVSTATVYAHFANKQALFDAFIKGVLGLYENQFAAASAVGGSARHRLTVFARLYFRLMSDPQLRAAYRIVSAETNLRPDLGAHLYREAHLLLGARLQKLLAGLVEDGALVIGDIPVAARLFEGMIEHVTLTLAMLQGDNSPTMHDAEAYCAEAIRVFMEGYRPGRSHAPKTPT